MALSTIEHFDCSKRLCEGCCLSDWRENAYTKELIIYSVHADDERLATVRVMEGRRGSEQVLNGSTRGILRRTPMRDYFKSTTAFNWRTCYEGLNGYGEIG